jgi:kumamolisin
VLDVEDISALAPGANIDVYEGPAQRRADSVAYDPGRVCGDHQRRRRPGRQHELGPVRAGRPAGQPGLQAAENYLFEQAAAQGQSVFGAAGDNGSDDCNSFETDEYRGRGPEPGVGRRPGKPAVRGVGRGDDDR